MEINKVICNWCNKLKNGVSTGLCNHCGRFGKTESELKRVFNPKRGRQDLLLNLLYNIVNNKHVQEHFDWNAIKAQKGASLSIEQAVSEYDKIWKEEIENSKSIPLFVEEITISDDIKHAASVWFTEKTYSEQHTLSDKYFDSRNPSLLTEEQVIEIYIVEFNKSPKIALKTAIINNSELKREIVDLLQNCWSDSAFNLSKQTNGEGFTTFSKWLRENL